MAVLALLTGSMPAAFKIGAVSRPSQSERGAAPLPPEERGSVAIDQALRDLTNPFTVLSIAARPGESDEGTLALYRKSYGARTVTLFATRGESGDSSNCGPTGPELGFTRTREALESARILGADVYFLNLRDFGYAKSANHALSVWGHDEALGKLVRAIRSLRPDVIITNTSTKTGDGQQQALAQLTREALTESANAERPGEAGAGPWRVRRLFERTDAARADIVTNLSERDAARGQSYAEIGLAARRRSAAMGSPITPVQDGGTAELEKSYYKLEAGENLESRNSLFAGLVLPENLRRSIAAPRLGDLSLLEATNKPAELITALHEKLLEKRAEGSAEDLQARYGAEYGRVIRFTSALERAIVLLLGLSLEVTVSDRVAVAGQKLTARATFKNGSTDVVPVVMRMPQSFSNLEGKSEYKSSDAIFVPRYSSTTREAEYEIPKEIALTMPRASHLEDEQYYPMGSSLPGALPVEPFGARLVVYADAGLGDVNIPLAALARYDTAAPVEIATIPFVVLKDWAKTREIEVTVRVRNRTPGALAGSLWVVPLALADDDYEPAHMTFLREDEEKDIKLKLQLPILKPPLAPDVLLEFRREKPESPEPLGLSRIAVNALGFDVADDLNVGYISGESAWLGEALNQLGINRSEIGVHDISIGEKGKTPQETSGCGDLARFDTIIVDRCAYFSRPELMLKNGCLLAYAKKGGNLIVFDQKADDWNLILNRSAFSPYPIKLSKNRIAVENSQIGFPDEAHTLLSKPNKIIAKDFDGWVGERAVNLPREWSPEFTPLIETNDPGEPSSLGGLLVARLGAGTYILTSLNWRAQLLGMKAGAYKMLANLVSYSKTNTRPRRVRSDKPARQ